MATRTEELRREIDQRRDDIGRDLEALGEKVSPGRMMQRQTSRITDRARGVRESVMGTAERAGEGVSGAAGELASGVREAPAAARQQVEGNPLAAGLVAFGAGLLVATTLPTSRTERRIAEMAQPAVQQAVGQAKQVGSEVVEDLREPAQQAMGDLRDTAAGAAEEVSSTAKGTTS